MYIDNNNKYLLSENNSLWISELYEGAIKNKPCEYYPWFFQHVRKRLGVTSWQWQLTAQGLSGQEENFRVFELFGEQTEHCSSRLNYTVNHGLPVTHQLNIGYPSTNGILDTSLRALVEFLLPNIVEAFHINLACSLQENLNTLKDQGIITDSGFILQSSDSFRSRLAQLKLLEDGRVPLRHLKELPSGRALVVSPLVLSKDSQLWQISFRIPSLLELLTPRQREVCAELVTGQPDKVIAKNLSISFQTVSNHIKKVYRLLDLSGRGEAIPFLMRHGF